MSNFSLTDIKTLFALSGNTCSYRGCEEPMTNPSWDEVNGQIAHIRSPKPNGPRPVAADYTGNIDGFDNLILLCPKCHTKVDRLEPTQHPVELLEAMKAEHEGRSKDAHQWATDEKLVQFAMKVIVAAAAGIGRTVPEVPERGGRQMSASISAGASISAAPSSGVLSDRADALDSLGRGPGASGLFDDATVKEAITSPAGDAQLTLELVDGSHLDVTNVGTADAFGVQVMPIAGRSVVDPAMIPPPRVEPGTPWRAGMLKHTDGSPVPVTVRLSWRDGHGRSWQEDFHFEAPASA